MPRKKKETPPAEQPVVNEAPKSKLDPVVEKVIELYALYGTPAAIFKQIKEEYGSAALLPNAVRKVREQYRKEILAKRQELTAKIPILDIQERMAYLQDILDGALEGDTMYTKNGDPYQKVDRTAALSALKMAQEITSVKGVVNDDNDETIRAIVQEAYEGMRGENPDKSDKEILEEILNELGHSVKPYVEEFVTVSSESKA